MNNSSIAKWCLRFGLAFVFVYASIEIFLSPERFLKYVPYFIIQLVPSDLFLPAFGVSEILLAMWLLSGWKVHFPSMLAALMMAAIVVFNMDYFQILFRNVAIGFGAIALVLLETYDEKASLSKLKT